MGKRSDIQVRLDELFGRLGAEANEGGALLQGILPERTAPAAPKSPGNGGKQGSPGNGGGNGKKLPGAEEAGSALRSTRTDSRRGQPLAKQEQSVAASKLGWEDYLDAIERSDQIRISYEGEQASGGVGSDAGKLLELPMKIGSERLGALQLEVGDNKNISPEEVALMAAVSQQVLQHIENLRLLEQAEKYRQEAEQASRRLTHTAWDEYLRSPSAPTRAYQYGDHRVEAVEPGAMLAEQAGCLVCELRVREETIGQLAVVQSQEQAEAASAFLAEIAGRLSSHIENLRLLEETERGRQQLDKRANELETVAKVSTTAASTLDPEVLLQSVVNLTKHSFHLYHAQVYLFDEATSLLELKAASGKIGEGQVREEHVISLYNQHSPVGKAANTRRGVMVGDVAEEADYPHNPALPGVRSEMAIPMLLGERLLGVFNVLSDQPQRFSSDDMLTYSTLAAQVAVALRNAELYAETLVTVERLRELDHLKSSFLANMSHELRTPLNSILGFTQVIQEGLDGPTTEDMSSDLALIEKNGRHLLTLINDVLDMAKIEAGRVNLSLEIVNLADLLEDVLQTTAGLARDRKLYLRLEQHSELAVQLELDHTRMRQVLINLVGNAIKFSESGGITVHLFQDEQRVRIEIRDTGIGIPPEKLDSVFEAFSQVDTSTTRKVGGTGLGLPISRKLVELHNGRLWAESTGVYGEGSVFILEFPRG
jgi:signal transduction histidine kinase/ferredoxin-fold anticodon binding domain-containing protein